MTGPTFSIAVVCWNNLAHTVRCIEALLRTNHHASEILVVDNGSSDGTRGYLAEMSCRNPALRAPICFEENRGWCAGINAAFREARGKYLVMLNNDVIVTPDWLEGLREAMDGAEGRLGTIRKVGLVGPVSNAVAGAQQVVNGANYGLDSLDAHARAHRANFRHNWAASWFLSGFCMMMRRALYDEVGGLDERFFPGGFDDNDLVLRAQEKGWEAVIAGDVYVHHEGSATFRAFAPEKQGGLVNRLAFLDKWREHRADNTRLIATYRVKNAAATLAESLDATARFADAIVVLDDGSSDETAAILQRHPAVTHYERQDLPFDERRDRNRLLSLASQMNPDWVISIDADEVFEMDRARAERLMQLADPHAKVLGFHWYTFWEPSHTYFRADGIFGNMSGYRMYRFEPGLRIVLGTENGLHCGNIPKWPDGAARYTNVRVRHLGYDTEELRRRKLAFYRAMDPNPRVEMVGNTDYGHLVSAKVLLQRYDKETGLSLCIITKDESERLAAFLSFFEPFVDEICVVDTGSRDDTVAIARRFTDRVASITQDRLDLAAARNACLDLATKPWVLCLDPDEEIALHDLPALVRAMDDEDVHAYSFQVENYQKDTPPVMTLAVRLFRRDERIRFSRPIHETVEQSVMRSSGIVVRPIEVRIRHHGFLKPDPVVEEKLTKYYVRNREYREQNPTDPLPWYNEALHLLNEDKEEEALAMLTHALRLDDAFLSPRTQLAQIYQERAMRLWRELKERLPFGHPLSHAAEQALQSLEPVTPARAFVGTARARRAR